jgi:NADH dehydrogenase/putative oxidoreductase
MTALWLAANEYPVSWLDPVLAAWVGAAIEIVGPVLLTLGLATRAAAAAMLGLTLVMQYFYQENDQHLAWAVLFGWYGVMGAGRLSVDRLMARGIGESALPFAGPIARFLASLTKWGGPLFQLFLRSWIAAIFFRSGLTKIADWDAAIFLFTDEYKVPFLPPELAAMLGTLCELSCPAFLVLGLGSRLFALPLIGMSIVIDLTYQHNVEHLYWIFILALIVVRGPGALSVDRLVSLVLRARFPLIVRTRARTMPPEGPHVVIVGAGFGGLAAAQGLRHTACHITLIDQHNYHLFQPLLYQIATAGLSPADIATPIREILRDQPNVKVVMGRVTGVESKDRAVITEDGAVHYDWLILATGAQHSYFGKDEWAPFAPGLKRIEDGTDVRRRLLLAFERAEAASDAEERSALLTFVVVGGGPTGVEWAGAIAELARFGMESEFREIDPATARVILVQAADRLLPPFPPALSAEAKAALVRLGVEVRLGAAVDHIDADGVVVSGQRIDARTVFWAAGVAASPAAKWLGAAADRAGRVTVGPDLTVPGFRNVVAIGDTASSTAWDGQPVPGLAPAAKQGGHYAAAVIRAGIEGRPAPAPFRYRHGGNLATIGRKAAVADFGAITLTGALAWWLWGVVHVFFLAGMRNRTAVALEWFWAYLTFRRGTRLITGAAAERPASPANP